MPFSGPWDLQMPGSMCFLLGSLSYILYVHSFGHLRSLFAGLILLSVLLLTYPADVLGLVNSPLDWDFQLGQERPEWEAKSLDERGWSVNRGKSRWASRGPKIREPVRLGVSQSGRGPSVVTLRCCGQRSLPGHLWPKELRDLRLNWRLHLSLSVSVICHLVIHEIAQETLAASLCLVSL